MLYEYLIENYKENEPILLSNIKIEGVSDVNVRQQIKKLSDDLGLAVDGEGSYTVALYGYLFYSQKKCI